MVCMKCQTYSQALRLKKFAEGELAVVSKWEELKEGKVCYSDVAGREERVCAEAGRLDGGGAGPWMSNLEVCPVDNGHWRLLDASDGSWKQVKRLQNWFKPKEDTAKWWVYQASRSMRNCCRDETKPPPAATNAPHLLVQRLTQGPPSLTRCLLLPLYASLAILPACQCFLETSWPCTC